MVARKDGFTQQACEACSGELILWEEMKSARPLKEPIEQHVDACDIVDRDLSDRAGRASSCRTRSVGSGAKGNRCLNTGINGAPHSGAAAAAAAQRRGRASRLEFTAARI